MNWDSGYARRPDVASELMDGEAIIIDLATGMYFSLDGVGGRIWDLLGRGASGNAVLASVLAEYEVGDDVARGDLEALVTQLLAENLIAPAGEPQAGNGAPAKAKVPYQAPRLVAYRDMGDLLALDPPAPGLSEISWHAGSAGEHEQ